MSEQKTVDEETVGELTLARVCHILGHPIPAHLQGAAHVPLTGVAAGVLASAPGNLYFRRSAGLRATEVDRLVERGITRFVASEPATDSAGKTYETLLVRNAEEAFVKVCREITRHYQSLRIAITGSVGKTTTKEMLQAVCAQKYSTLFSWGNQNGLAQVGRYAQKQTPETQVYIQETGAARPGMVHSAAQILRPNAFVFTNIGLNHVGAYGNRQENLLADKLSLDLALPEDGVAFINYDDKVLREQTFQSRTVFFSATSSKADYYATGVNVEEGRLNFTVVERSSGAAQAVSLTAFGRHNVVNAVAAFAVGRWLKIPGQQIAAGLGKYRSSGLRQNLLQVGEKKLLIDCYNASESSARSVAEALATVTSGPEGRRILVFADIDNKLGQHTRAVHARVGRMLAESGLDHFVLFGKHCAWVQQELADRSLSTFHTEGREELHRHLEENIQAGDVVGFKGGQQMALSITVDSLFGTGFAVLDGDVLQRRGEKFTEGGLVYRSIREYGAVLWSVPRDFSAAELLIPGRARGLPVYMVGRLACGARPIKAVRVEAPVRTIGTSAFFNCRSLAQVELPETLRVIERSAFNNCRALQSVVIPPGVVRLEDRVFYRCPQLTHVTMPPTVVNFGEDIFHLSPRVIVRGVRGSAAEGYCKRHGITFEAL